MDDDDSKHPTLKLIGMDARKHDKQTGKLIGRQRDEERYVDDWLMNASYGVGVDDNKGIDKEKLNVTKRDDMYVF